MMYISLVGTLLMGKNQVLSSLYTHRCINK